MNTYHLLSAGSNSGGQLGTGSQEDSHKWSQSLCQPVCASSDSSNEQPLEPFPPPGSRVVQLAGGANHSLALLIEESSGGRSVWRAGDGEKGQWGAELQARQQDKDRGRATVFTPLPGATDLLRLDLAGQEAAAEPRSSLTPKLVAASWENSYIVYTPTLFDPDGNERGDDVLLVLGRENDFGQTGLGKGQVGALGAGLISLAGALPQDEEEASARGRVELVQLVGSVRHVVLIASWLSSVGTSGGAARRRRYALIGWGAGRQGQLGSLEGPRATPPPGRGKGSSAGNIVWTPRLIRLWFSEQLEIDNQASLSLGRDHTALLVPPHWRSEDTAPPSGRRESEQENERLLLLGSNKYGQLAVGNCFPQSAEHALPDIYSVACTWNSTLLALADGSLLASGRNDKGQLGGDVQPQRDALAASSQAVRVAGIDTGCAGQAVKQTLVCGSEHALLLLRHSSSEGASETEGEGSSVWGWGWNEHGNLALGGQVSSPGRLDGESGEKEQPEAVEDQRTPVRLWPAPGALITAGSGSGSRTAPEGSGEMQRVHEVATDVWAGCATSFVQVLRIRR